MERKSTAHTHTDYIGILVTKPVVYKGYIK